MLTRDLPPPSSPPRPAASMGALYSMRWSFICCECAGEDLRRLHCTREPSGEEIKSRDYNKFNGNIQQPRLKVLLIDSAPRGQRVKTRTKWAGFNPREGFRLKNTVCVCVFADMHMECVLWCPAVAAACPLWSVQPPRCCSLCGSHSLGEPWSRAAVCSGSSSYRRAPPPPPFLSLPLPPSDNTCNNTVTFLHLLPTPPSSAWTPITPTAPPNIYSGKQVETLDECGCCQNARSISQIILTNTAAFYVKSGKKKRIKCSIFRW